LDGVDSKTLLSTLQHVLSLDGATLQLCLLGGAAFYALFLKPGVARYALDALLFKPLDSVFTREIDSVKLTKRVAAGTFGNVYTGTTDDGRVDIIGKKWKKTVEGSAAALEVELYMARLSRRSPDLGAVTASFLGSVDTGDEQPVLVWRAAGTTTLASLLLSRSAESDIADALSLDVRGLSDAAVGNRAAKAVMRQLLTAVSLLHSAGVVHRDLKPENLLVSDAGRVLLLDFGAAVDLRTGLGWDPDIRVADPNYSPPEAVVLPENTPLPPPGPLAAALSPLLWAVARPDLFDAYSCGVILLQLGLPALRRRTAVGPDGTFKRDVIDADYDLRRWRAGCNPTVFDFAILDCEGALGWDLCCRLITRERSGRLGCDAALLHPWLLLP
jgi:serine/threonine protein kinase